MRFWFFLLVFCVHCAPKTVYDDTAFNAVSRKNDTISYIGTYVAKTVGSYKNVTISIDSSTISLEYLDSLRKTQTAFSKWSKQGFDTQTNELFSPFNKMIFKANGVFLLDTLENIFVPKSTDTLTISKKQG